MTLGAVPVHENKKARRDLSRGPCNFIDDGTMPVICPTCQIRSRGSETNSLKRDRYGNLLRAKGRNRFAWLYQRERLLDATPPATD
jgi:hypothetical protein